MPKVVDHAVRRRQVADAVERLIGEHGYDRLTIARVAAAAGISVGLVQHYFATKDELLGYTFQHVMRRVRRRVERHVARSVPERRAIADVVYDALAELLPLDAERRAEYRVTLAFLGRTVDDPALAEVHRATVAGLRDDLVRAIGNGVECGEVPDASDAERQAVMLIATVDGLALAGHADPDGTPPATMLPILRDRIAAVFCGECHQWGRREPLASP